MRFGGLWLGVAAGLALAGSAPAEVRPVRFGAEWRPSEAYVAQLEPKLVLPRGAKPLAAYARYYAGITIEGRRAVEVYMVTAYPIGDRRPGRRIVRHRNQGFIADGGCGVVTIIYLVVEKHQAMAACNGLG